MTEELKDAAQSVFADAEPGVKPARRQTGKEFAADTPVLKRMIEEATRSVIRPRVLLIGGDARCLQLNWPTSWKVTHYRADARNLEEPLRAGAADLAVVFTRWTPRPLRKHIDKYACRSMPMVLCNSTPAAFVKICNEVEGRPDARVDIPYPPGILKAKSIRELLRAMIPHLDLLDVDAPPVEKLLILCRGMAHTVPALQAYDGLDKIEEAVRSTYAAILKAESVKLATKVEAAAREEMLARQAEEAATQPMQSAPAEEKPMPPKKATDPEVEAMYAAVGALAADTKRKDAWTKDELEMLIAAWQECAADADILLENMRTLGSKRTATSVMFQLQRVASSVPGVKVSPALIDRLKELSVADRKKSTLGIVEFVEKQKGTPAATTPQWTEADTRMWTDPPPVQIDKLQALVEYIVQGVALGLDTKEQAFDKIAKLVKR